MYAIIQDGGKQYKVAEGETLLLDLKDIDPGSSIDFNEVLMYSSEDDIRVGTPTVPGVKVTGIVEREEKGDKLTIVKFRRRKSSKTKMGHRQKYTRVKIQKITAV
jgi:large subunit ribosomal protein L21